jgi:hypothetical protein
LVGSALEQRLEHAEELRSERPQLCPVVEGKPTKHRLPGRRQPDVHLPAVDLAPSALDQPPRGESVDQLDGAVVVRLKPLGQLADRRRSPLRPPSDREQELVLARANAITNQVFYLSVNAAGPRGRGHSIYVGPEGEVLAYVGHAEPEVTHLVLDLDRVSEVRTHGTAGLNRVWEQLRADDDPIDLPVYEGRMAHGSWRPATQSPRSTR